MLVVQFSPNRQCLFQECGCLCIVTCLRSCIPQLDEHRCDPLFIVNCTEDGQALFGELYGRSVIALTIGKFRGASQQPGASHCMSLRRLAREHSRQPFTSLTKITVYFPEQPERTSEAQTDFPGAVCSLAPFECRAQVIMFLLHAVDPLQLFPALQL